MGSKVAVIGAGAFGGWTAFHLQREGAEVTLIDAWGPGNSRSSSGGESRVIRSIYGPHPEYATLMARAYALWNHWQGAWGRRLYIRTGGIWLFAEDDHYASSSLPLLEGNGIKAERWELEKAVRRFPQINFEDVRSVFFEAGAGYLLARQSCRVVADEFVSMGGRYLQSMVAPVREEGACMESVLLSDGSKLEADHFVFACGPWLGRMFGDAIGRRIRPTRQEVFYFGCPAGDESYSEKHMPVWVDFHRTRGPHGANWDRSASYGIPGNEDRGFKIAEDVLGDDFDPTNGDRIPSQEGIEAARKHLAFRFPGLGNPPLLEARVCQYENSPDSHFVLDRHPRLENVWIAGGGSGHGFKMGPAVGEMMAALVLGKREAMPKFSMQRLLDVAPPEEDEREAGAAGAFGQS
jgi:glycine/D-amino acid oxidase-like deaminating enzyme